MEDKQERYIDTITNDKNDWYAIRLYTTKQEEVAQFFTENGIETFIPKQYVAEEDKQGRVHQKLKPVVRNLLFVKKTMGDADFKRLLHQVGGSRFVERMKEPTFLYECVNCHHRYPRMRKMNTNRYVCGKCRGKLILLD